MRLMPMFRCSNEQIHRWRKELGIEVKSRNDKRTICQCTDSGRVVKTYKSMGDAARSVGGATSNLWKATNGIISKAYGWVWRYADE